MTFGASEEEDWHEVHRETRGLGPAFSPVVGGRYRYHEYFKSNLSYTNRVHEFTVGEVGSDRCCRDTTGRFWDFRTGGFWKVASP